MLDNMWKRWKHAVVHFLRTQDEGAATAEFAVVLPVIIALVALILYCSHAAVVAMECQEEAATLARAVVISGHMDAPHRDGIHVEIHEQGQQFEVVTHCSVIPDPMNILPEVVRGRVVGVRQ